MNSHVTVTQIRKYQEFYTSTSSLGFPGGSAGEESAHNARGLCLTPGLERSPGEGTATNSSVLVGELRGPWGRRESDTTERLTFFISDFSYLLNYFKDKPQRHHSI